MADETGCLLEGDHLFLLRHSASLHPLIISNPTWLIDHCKIQEVYVIARDQVWVGRNIFAVPPLSHTVNRRSFISLAHD